MAGRRLAARSGLGVGDADAVTSLGSAGGFGAGRRRESAFWRCASEMRRRVWAAAARFRGDLEAAETLSAIGASRVLRSAATWASGVDPAAIEVRTRSAAASSSGLGGLLLLLVVARR